MLFSSSICVVLSTVLCVGERLGDCGAHNTADVPGADDNEDAACVAILSVTLSADERIGAHGRDGVLAVPGCGDKIGGCGDTAALFTVERFSAHGGVDVPAADEAAPFAVFSAAFSAMLSADGRFGAHGRVDAPDVRGCGDKIGGCGDTAAHEVSSPP